jgi:hypothetical protein
LNPERLKRRGSDGMLMEGMKNCSCSSPERSPHQMFCGIWRIALRRGERSSNLLQHHDGERLQLLAGLEEVVVHHHPLVVQRAEVLLGENFCPLLQANVKRAGFSLTLAEVARRLAQRLRKSSNRPLVGASGSSM